MKRPKIFRGAERESEDMTLGDHIRELRYRLLVCVGTVVVAMVPAWFFYDQLIEVLNAPYCDALRGVDGTADCNFLVTNLLDPFSLRLKVAGYGGLFLAMPVILWQIWRFIAPGLYKKERRYALAFTVSSFGLFITGAAVAYLTLTQAVNFLVRVGGPDIDIRSGPSEFVRLSLFMMLAFGTGFLFPVVLVALQMIGIVSPRQLSSWRRQTALVIVIIAAAITPSGDPISLAALAIPMYVFYEIAVLLGRIMVRRKDRAGEPDGAAV
ncbi:MAG: twin-arginine translocase subunit TatC [Microthrixaceae bacterium]